LLRIDRQVVPSHERMFAYVADGPSKLMPDGPTIDLDLTVRGRRTGAGSGRRAREQRLLAGERLARRGVDLDRHDLPRPREAGEVHGLVVSRAAAHARRIRARRALDEHVERPADEPL